MDTNEQINELFGKTFDDLFKDFAPFIEFSEKCISKFDKICTFVGSHGKVCIEANCMLYKKKEKKDEQ